jgi:hypothetical protein
MENSITLGCGCIIDGDDRSTIEPCPLHPLGGAGRILRDHAGNEVQPGQLDALGHDVHGAARELGKALAAMPVPDDPNWEGSSQWESSKHGFRITVSWKIEKLNGAATPQDTRP